MSSFQDCILLLQFPPSTQAKYLDGQDVMVRRTGIDKDLGSLKLISLFTANAHKHIVLCAGLGLICWRGQWLHYIPQNRIREFLVEKHQANHI